MIDHRAYSGAIYDIIKFELGYKENFVLPNDINCLVPPFYNQGRFIFGRAFTARGDKTPIPDLSIIDRMIDNFVGNSVYILQANDNSRAHFGDIMAHFCSRAKMQGAILQGWTRDIDRIESLGFPIWAKGVQPQDSSDRWGITTFQERIVIGNIFITPNDYIFADRDAVLIIRERLVSHVLKLLPAKLDYEERLREAISEGKSAQEIHIGLGRW